MSSDKNIKTSSEDSMFTVGFRRLVGVGQQNVFGYFSQWFSVYFSLHYSVIILALASLTLLHAGCSSPKAIFPVVNPPIVWPNDGSPLRLRYIGELKQSSDLK